jgi:predicted membrane channel-forming protein YqfA (hemolysin III family)
MTPVIGTPAAAEHARLFWLGFALLDVVAALLLFVFARLYGQDTPATRRSAWVVMFFVYAAVALLGIYFLFDAFSGQTPQYRTAVQALIFLALGSGGLVINAIKRQ